MRDFLADLAALTALGVGLLILWCATEPAVFAAWLSIIE